MDCVQGPFARRGLFHGRHLAPGRRSGTKRTFAAGDNRPEADGQLSPDLVWNVQRGGCDLGIDVSWVGEDDEQIQFISDAQGALMAFVLRSVGVDNTVCLRFIDPFGDTTFNQRQLPILASELEAAASAGAAMETVDQLRSIARLVRTAEGKGHTYIKFIGD